MEYIFMRILRWGHSVNKFMIGGKNAKKESG